MTPQRTDAFVPLTVAPASPGRREFSVSVIQGGDASKNFQSLAVPPLSAESGVDNLKSKIQNLKSPCEPRVSVQRDGNRVTHLRVQCACGEVLDLACVYEEKN